MKNTIFLDLHIKKNIDFEEAWLISLYSLKKLEEKFRDIYIQFDKFTDLFKDNDIHPDFDLDIINQYFEAKKTWNKKVFEVVMVLNTIASGNIILEQKIKKISELIIT